jgi:hypothetical protein
MRAYAFVELGDSEAIDLFLREEDARRALEEALYDEPAWTFMDDIDEHRAVDVTPARKSDCRVGIS